MSINLNNDSLNDNWVQFFPETKEGSKILDDTKKLFDLFEKMQDNSDSGIDLSDSSSPTLIQRFIRVEEDIDGSIIKYYNKTLLELLEKDKPQDALYKTQAGLVALSPKQEVLSQQFEALSLDPVKTSPEIVTRNRSINTLQRAVSAIPKESLIQDMTVLHKALAPHIAVVQGENGFNAVANGVDIKTDENFTKADTAIIMGSNDLWQVTSFYFDIYSKLPQETQKNLKIYISGFGGHGTTNGPIFGHTEASTMAKWLVDFGVPQENIIIESNATNSGQNIQFCDKLFEENNHTPKKLIISGTPAADYRQILTALGQSKYSANFESLAMSPSPRWETEYFDSKKSSTIYTLCFLRELGSYVAYTLTSQFIAPIPLHDEKAFKEGMVTTLNYYNTLAKPESLLSKLTIEKLADDYLAFSKEKALLTGNGKTKLTDPQMSELKGKYKHLIDAFTPINAFFRDSFAHFDNDMIKLSRELSFGEHSQALRETFGSRGFDALSLDSPRGEGSFQNTASLFESHES